MVDLILPSPMDLENYRNGLDDDKALQLAADLFTMATGISTQEQLDTPLERRLFEWAVLEMAWAITERHEDKEAEFSRFNSERIGSYSYSKAQQAISDGEKTGVSAFDDAVAYFLAKALGAQGTGWDSEWVFKKGYQEPGGRFPLRDPSQGWWS